MLPDFLEVYKTYGCFYFDTVFKTIILPKGQLKKFDAYSEEYKKVFGVYPDEKWTNRKWSKIIKKLLGE